MNFILVNTLRFFKQQVRQCDMAINTHLFVTLLLEVWEDARRVVRETNKESHDNTSTTHSHLRTRAPMDRPGAIALHTRPRVISFAILNILRFVNLYSALLIREFDTVEPTFRLINDRSYESFFRIIPPAYYETRTNALCNHLLEPGEIRNCSKLSRATFVKTGEQWRVNMDDKLETFQCVKRY